MKTPDLSGYENWLVSEGYQPSTIEVTLRHIKVAAANQVRAVDHVPHVRRYLRFVTKTRRNPLGKPFATNMKRRGFKPASEIRKQGSRDRELLTVRQWKALRARLRRRTVVPVVALRRAAVAVPVAVPAVAAVQ